MRTPLIAISGPMAAGKSTLARELQSRAGALVITTHGPLYARVSVARRTRRALQDAGVALDRETRGRWVLEHCRNELGKNPGTSLAVLDCVRNQNQLKHIGAEWDGPVLHLHLTAPTEVLAARYRERGDPSSMGEAQRHSAEQGIAQLGQRARLTMATSLVKPAQAARTALAHMDALTDLAARLRKNGIGA